MFSWLGSLFFGGTAKTKPKATKLPTSTTENMLPKYVAESARHFLDEARRHLAEHDHLDAEESLRKFLDVTNMSPDLEESLLIAYSDLRQPLEQLRDSIAEQARDMDNLHKMLAEMKDTERSSRSSARDANPAAIDAEAGRRARELVEAQEVALVAESEKWRAEQLAANAALEPDVERLGTAELISALREICQQWAEGVSGDDTLSARARAIGEVLFSRGGMMEMRNAHAALGGIRGARTLEMHWDGIGTWRG